MTFEWLSNQEFWFAVAGGFAVNIVRLAELANVKKIDRPTTFTDWIYCVQFFILPFIGGFLAYAYVVNGTKLGPILAINVGASAPALLKAAASAAASTQGEDAIERQLTSLRQVLISIRTLPSRSTFSKTCVKPFLLGNWL